MRRNRMKRSQIVGWGLMLITSSIVATLAWSSPPSGETPPARGPGRMHHGFHEPMHAGMRAQMQAHDARLDELVAAMNAAEGSAKVDAIAAVVNEIVAQRRTRRSHLEERWKKQHDGSETKAPGSNTP